MVPDAPASVHTRTLGVSPIRFRSTPRPALHGTVPGDYSPVPAWESRTLFKRAARVVSASWRKDRRESFLAVVDVMADAADGRTGRSVTLSVDTIALRAGVDFRRAQRRIADAHDVGLCVTVDGGSYLTGAARQRSRRVVGRFAIRKASTRALTIPRELADLTRKRNVALPAPQGAGSLSSESATHQARKRAARTTPTPTTKPRSLRLQRLAGKLSARFPWLTRQKHIGHLCNLLERAGIDAETWTAEDVARALDDWHLGHSRNSIGIQSTNPLGWLAWALRTALQAGAQPRAVRQAREADERAQRAAIRRREQEARDAIAPEVRKAVLVAGAAAARAAILAARSPTGGQGSFEGI